MPEEEKTEVEETEAEEKTEIEAEEKTVEEAKVEEKTTEPVKEAPDAKEETKLGGGGSDSGDSEISYEMQKAIETIPLELPLGAVFTFNVHHIGNNYGPENYVSGCIGLFDGVVLRFRIYGEEIQYGEPMEYSAFIANWIHPISSTAPKVLELSECGCSMPSKDSTKFTMNMVCIGGDK